MLQTDTWNLYRRCGIKPGMPCISPTHIAVGAITPNTCQCSITLTLLPWADILSRSCCVGPRTTCFAGALQAGHATLVSRLEAGLAFLYSSSASSETSWGYMRLEIARVVDPSCFRRRLPAAHCSERPACTSPFQIPCVLFRAFAMAPFIRILTLGRSVVFVSGGEGPDPAR